MKIYAKCSCGYTEELNKDLILKIIGGVITIGGAAIMAYSTEIAIWLSERYECPNCGKKEWKITHN